jgi:archaellum component FlaC
MKKLFAYGIAFILLMAFTGCQIPGGTEALEKITEAVEMMEEVETQLDDIQAQLDELTDAFNTLADEYDKHLEKYHKAAPIKKTITKKEGLEKKITK